MDSVKLKVSISDWIYITIIGTLFGLFISLFFYFLNDIFHTASTVLFGISSAFLITIFSSVFITISNNHILPNIDKKFWYFVSFLFSFLSGALGFLFSYSIFYIIETDITDIIEPYSLYLTVTVGSLTFLIGLILHQFISMKYKNESISSEIQNSKLKALENELNPHFLFNALNSISELIYMDQKKAEKATLDLSDFLRNAITRESIIDLQSEIKMVKTYLKIENIRFDDNIKLEFDISKELNNVSIPRFSIQLLVENAIKHGFNGKKLLIKIKANGQKIEVTNNGVFTKNIKFGTGLSNLQKRLELLDIGNLSYNTEKNNMMFIINLKGK
jgi:sensor histidine kinase YesM